MYRIKKNSLYWDDARGIWTKLVKRATVYDSIEALPSEVPVIRRIPSNKQADENNHPMLSIWFYERPNVGEYPWYEPVDPDEDTYAKVVAV